MARSPANLITAAALLGLPAASFALGLGDIQLKSALNQPLDAQIEILGATPQDLRDLHATVAARDTFNRYGLDYPQMLGSFHFSVEKGADGRDVLRVTSPQPVTEPFLTFLVEADWARGRLLREYTVLLDPPVFMTEQQTQVAVEAPRGAAAQPAPGAGRIERPAEPAAPTAVERPRADEVVAQPAVAGGEYRVQRGDTLWVIASQTKPDASISQNQMMVALYRNNPDAFLGNMNLVKEGALLHVPSSSEINATPSGDASAEVSRQTNEWRGGSAVAHAGSEAQLKLVPPKAGAEGAATSAQTSAAPSAASAAGTAEARDAAARAEQRSASLSAENADLKGQLDEAHRLLAVKDAQLAKMQQSLAAGASTQEPVATAQPPGETGVNLESGQTSPTTAEPAATSEPVETTAPTPVESEPVAETPAAKPVPPPAVAPAPAPEPEARTSWVAALFSHTWLWVVAGLALVLGAAGLALKRRRPQLAPLEALEDETPPAAGLDRIEPEFERTIAEATPAAMAGKKPRVAPTLAPAAAAGSSDTGTFEITGTFRPVDFDTTGGASSGDSEAYPFEDSGSALAIDQADPISEADFHMAYGLYDQASDLIKKALDREPGREDLQLKLLEILFMWSNKDAFRQQAQAFRADLTRGGQWDKIVIMGKQLCPGDALFDAAPGLSAGGGVDLDLATSKMAAPSVRPGAAPGADAPSLDLDLDDALTARADLHSAETVPATGEYLELARKGEPEEVEVHDEQLTAVARRLEARMRPRAGDVGVALDLGETIAPEDVSATRTLTEQKPGKKSDDDAFGDFFAFTGVAEAPEPDPTGTREVVLDFEGDLLPDSTTAEFKIELPEDGSSIDLDVGATGVHLPKLGAGAEGGTTAMLVPSGDTTVVSSFGDTATMQAPGFVDPTARTVQAPRLGGLGGAIGGSDPTVSSESLDFNIGESDGGDGDRGSTLRVSPSELALPEAEDGVLDEVGTKLDLARAYIDMGDSDGARSILEEVIEEGDESQRQNAHTLLRSIA